MIELFRLIFIRQRWCQLALAFSDCPWHATGSGVKEKTQRRKKGQSRTGRNGKVRKELARKLRRREERKECGNERHKSLHIKLCLLLMFKFLKTISLLLCVLRDFSVLFPEIKIGSNRIESATCR